jgi:hypothetical protein
MLAGARRAVGLLWTELRTMKLGFGQVATSKLLVRKRPHSISIYDKQIRTSHLREPRQGRTTRWHRQRFGFTDQSGPLTAEVAAVLSGPTAPDAEGNHEFSVVLVWVTRKPGAPAVQVIDQIVGSVHVHGANPAH